MLTNEQKNRVIKLTNALDSGVYPQGKGKLKQWNEANKRWEYCCQGVACEIFKDELQLLEIGDEIAKFSSKGKSTGEYFDEYVWPIQVADYLGLNNETPTLMSRNDGTSEFIGNKQTFPQISAYLLEIVKGDEPE